MLVALAVPILAAKCLTCHDTKAKTAGLDLSTRQAALAGGAKGAAIVPGKPEDSRLYQYVRDGKMPPGRRLANDEVAAIREWIDGGAPWDSTKPGAAAREQWWSLRDVVRPPVPKVAGAHPIDAFLLDKLDAKGLDFAPEADRRTRIRRLHLTLTGLPPKPDELSEDFDAAVERLLASPRYAERWARHWLDVVRFGETDGGEHNNERLTAWKYRDYVIDAFRADKPYDRFVREQVAGDAMDPHNPSLVAATGFLVAGPWDSVTKEINRDEMFRKTIRQDELDDFVTATFGTFQGLTVGCARCHDHKFDPIPTRDYYRLTAVFRGITYGERAIYTDAEKKAYDERVAPLRKGLARVRAQIDEIEAPPKTRLLREKYETAERARMAAGGKHLPVNPIVNRNAFPPVAARRFRFTVTAQQGRSAPKVDRLELLPVGVVVKDWRGSAPASDDRPQWIELEAAGPVSEIRWSADAVTGKSDGAPRVYRFEASDDGATWRTVAGLTDHDSAVEFLLPDVAAGELAALIPGGERERHRALTAERTNVEAAIAAIAKPATAHAAFPEPEMLPAYLLDRGSVAKPLEELTPGALSCVTQLAADLAPAGSTDAKRRLALASWLTDKRNPLTARVMVNRVWAWHFGAGLVNTPSDFGVNGDKPSHPELLDWLAARFMENGWSIRWLQRQILATRAWGQSSAFNEKANEVDASNRLLWHRPLQRADSETLRDSLLAVSGSLSTEAGGPSVWLHKSKASGSYLYLAADENDPSRWRRAVYRFTVRGGQRLFMDSFDCPDPAVATPARSVSNTPVQALTLLNNAFVLRQAELLAERATRESPGDPVGRAYALLFQREPSARDRELARAFLAENSLALYCRALLNTNEFVYVP
ncbi:MAG: PSD1 and planctomycete cytochrome C domain-containing protein [Bryobacteraceae bacterium]